MSLLIKLLISPVLAPIRGTIWIAEKMAEQAENELYDEDAVRGGLVELELRYDLGEIGEEEYLAAEDELLARLKVIRERRAEREG